MKKTPGLGEQEWQVLSFVNERAPATVRDIAANFPQLARTTVLTMMERLRQKGFLQRTKVDGVFHYSPRQEQQHLVRRQISEFVQKTLGGSVNPFLRFLSEDTNLTEDEKKQLEKIAARLEKES